MAGAYRLGHEGLGSRTGRGRARFGRASGSQEMTGGEQSAGPGRAGVGGGRWRHRHWYDAAGLADWLRARMGWSAASFTTGFSQEQELEAMRQQAANLDQALSELRARIQQLEKSGTNDAVVAAKE